MNGTQTFPVTGVSTSTRAVARVAGVPWYCFAVVLGAACIPIGVLWDISWHQTIGRDTFWTPAHMMIYLGGALPGCVCGWLALKNTFWAADEDAASRTPTVRLWGFRAPLGAWVVIWGSFAMMVSAPFDNWWHNAYGLDVKIISPPHTILAVGTYAVAIGGLLLALASQNRATEQNRFWITTLVLISFATLLTKVVVFTTEYNYPNQQHTGTFYKVAGLVYPLWLVAAARSAKLRWGATATAAIFSMIWLSLVWLLPLFPGQARLGPIYNPVTHMVPPPFLLLLVAPAVMIDLLMRWFGTRPGFWRDTALAVGMGVLFFLVVLAVQWPFSEFLLSPASRNAFFAGNAIWSYDAKLGPWCTQFWDPKEVLTIKAGVMACLFASVQSRIALWIGNWFSSIKR